MRMAAAALAVLAAGRLAGAQACAANPVDKTAVVETLKSMYAAAMADDRVKLRGVFAPGAYLFDGGVKFGSIDSLMQGIEKLRAQGMKFVWSVTDPDVHVSCGHAWIAFLNVGSVQMPAAAAATPTKWLESADLEKQDGQWKIVFFQSTRVPAAEPTPATVKD
jgi:hypothetical protein